MIRAIFTLWRKRQRAIDLDVLWPICKREAFQEYDGQPDVAMAHAKAAFAVHAFNDPAWLALGKAEIIARIDALE